MNIISVTILLASALVAQANDGPDFCYEGDCHWDGKCGTGRHQSPVNLRVPTGIVRPAAVQLDFNSEYKTSEGFYIWNNGHTVQVSLPHSKARMTGYELENEYILAQIHFHWGENDTQGAEHAVNGYRGFPVEVHMVHYDSQYASLNEAANSDYHKAVSVVGVFLTLGTEEDENLGFDTISPYLPINYHNESQFIANVSLDVSSFLPKERATFFRYLGSLTTPPCAEAVEWTVIEEPIPVKPSEIAKFHEVLDHSGEPMGLNYRELQPLGNRVVEYLVRAEEQSSGASKYASSFMISWIIAATVLLL